MIMTQRSIMRGREIQRARQAVDGCVVWAFRDQLLSSPGQER
jgi:hypothetical protein